MAEARASTSLNIADLLRRMPEEARRKVWAETMPGAYPGDPKLQSPPGHTPAETPRVAPLREEIVRRPAAPGLYRPDTVRGVMPFYEPRKAKAALQSVRSFEAQVHPSKYLVVVNGATRESLVPPTVDLREARVPAGAGLGRYYNLGVSDTPADHVVALWDADTYYHPLRLAVQTGVQASTLPTSACVMLRRQVRVNLSAAVAFVHEDPDGIPETAVGRFSRYDFGETGDRPELRVVAAQGRDTVVVDNPAFLSVAFYVRGQSAANEADWMGPAAGEANKILVDDPVDLAYLHQVAALYGLRLGPPQSTPRPPGDVGVSGRL